MTSEHLDADHIARLRPTLRGIRSNTRPEAGQETGLPAAGLLETLIRRFPAVFRLAGREVFNAAAAAYVEGEARKASFHAEFGENFCEYLENCREAVALPWLPDLARFEWLRWKAQLAPDHPSLTGRDLRTVRPEQAPYLLIEPHPSLGMIASPYSIVSVWETHGADAETRRVSLRRGWEEAMIVRQGRSVRILRMPPGAYQFIDKIRKGATLIAALEAAADWCPQFDMTRTLKWFSRSGAIAGFRLAKGV